MMYPAGRAPPETELHALVGTAVVDLDGALVFALVEGEGKDEDEWCEELQAAASVTSAARQTMRSMKLRRRLGRSSSTSE
jgi:ribosomal protein L12E/L44/L45/RPP1/RPP2